MARNPIIRLKSRESARLRAGSPWVFSNEIAMDAAAKALAPGSQVSLAASDGTILGTGYFNPRSLISVRLLAKEPCLFDADFFVRRLRTALSLREKLYDAPFYRLVHAEGDGMPGLVIDRFGDTCVVQITTAGMELLSDAVLAAIDTVIAPEHVILRNDAPSRALEGLESYVRVTKGEPSLPLIVQENGIRYFADPAGGQKTGWYYDQRDNRAFAAKLAAGANVLDAFSYTGGFGVLAACAGAKRVTLLDSSEAALGWAEKAAEENGIGEKCVFVKADAMLELEKRSANERYDVVICDPPPFVRAKKDLESGARAYRKLARLGATLTAPGGYLLLASCSHNISPERFAQECAAGIARSDHVSAALIHQAGAGADHPVHPALPETAYLKALVYRLS
jgi:23S rRNA (cytosine1962-C5)-methyltransferase